MLKHIAIALCALLGLLVIPTIVSRAADYKPDDEGFIRNWLMFAPIKLEGSGADEIDKQQLKDEGKLQPKEGDKAKAGDAELTWKAIKAADAGVDAVVAQGSDGGGHVGHRTTFTLVPQVVDVVSPLPVLAAGGVVDARGVAAALVLGAAGVLLGTRFVATPEAPVAEGWKQAIVSATGDDTVSTKLYDALRGESWPGAVVRTVRNRWTDEWAGRPEEWAAVAEELRPSFLESMAAGEFPMAGEGAGLIRDVTPAGDLPRALWEGALAILRESRSL